MRYIQIILLFAVIEGTMYGQEILTLEECQQRAVENYPLIKQTELLEEVYQLKEKNIKSNWLPQFDLGAKATYQSDVVEIAVDLPFPAEFPNPSKDQYSAYIDINQTIYDGGIAKHKQNLEYFNTRSKQKQVQVELLKVKEQVSNVFFQVLLLQENIQLTNTMEQELDERINVAKSAVENGSMLKSDLQELKAEKFKVKQRMAELQSDLKASKAVLADYTGIINKEEGILLQKPEPVQTDTLKNQRPEKEVFELKKMVFETNQNLIKAQRHPRLMAFGQAGYGKPGLNIISDEFDTYYLFGVRLSWSIFDWNTNQRERQILEVQKSIVKSNEDAYDVNMAIALERQHETIKKLEKLLEMDDEIIELRQEVAAIAASKLDNGTITSVDYLAKLNEVSKAKSAKALHSMQLLHAYSTYKLLLGH